MNKKALLGCQLRQIRLEHFGEDGLNVLARALNIPPQTWLNYERGVTMPAEVLLGFLQVTGADPQSLFNGKVEPTVVRIT